MGRRQGRRQRRRLRDLGVRRGAQTPKPGSARQERKKKPLVEGGIVESIPYLVNETDLCELVVPRA